MAAESAAMRWSAALLLVGAAACSPAGPDDPVSNDAAAHTVVPAVEETPQPEIKVPKTSTTATPEPPSSLKPVSEKYSAYGQEPGWLVTIADGRIDYTGNYGEKTISVAQPAPRMTGNGYRYEAGRLIIAIDRGRCNDAMSGQGFADTVTVRADGETYLGCGGARRPGWDM
ncbi:MAG TPA: hypothetical protein VJ859_12070 [Allosphingosinicella sp.]|nr:hypothetical protein [Allosphingosinicella sp.]